MSISSSEVREGVIEILREMVSARDTPEINDGTDPIHGLGLVSDDGLDFACEISTRFGFHFPDDLNPFVDDAGHRARLVREIVDLIAPMIPDIKEAHSG